MKMGGALLFVTAFNKDGNLNMARFQFENNMYEIKKVDV
jgi:hypothetical protein